MQEKSEIHPEVMKNHEKQHLSVSICQVARKDGEPVVSFVLRVGLEGGKLESNDGSLAWNLILVVGKMIFPIL